MSYFSGISVASVFWLDVDLRKPYRRFTLDMPGPLFLWERTVSNDLSLCQYVSEGFNWFGTESLEEYFRHARMIDYVFLVCDLMACHLAWARRYHWPYIIRNIWFFTVATINHDHDHVSMSMSIEFERSVACPRLWSEQVFTLNLTWVCQVATTLRENMCGLRW